MRDRSEPVRHLSDDEIVDRVFPSTEAAPVPIHLATCTTCQGRVARLREAWLLDRGAVEGTVEAIGDEAWRSQAASVMARVRDEASRPARGGGVAAFRLRWPEHLVRRPALAVGSVAAALLLVTTMTLLRPHPPAPRGDSSRVEATAVAVAVAVAAVTATATATASASASTAPSMSPGDASDDQLLRDVERLVAGEVPLYELLPQEGV